MKIKIIKTSNYLNLDVKYLKVNQDYETIFLKEGIILDIHPQEKIFKEGIDFIYVDIKDEVINKQSKEAQEIIKENQNLQNQVNNLTASIINLQKENIELTKNKTESLIENKDITESDIDYIDKEIRFIDNGKRGKIIESNLLKVQLYKNDGTINDAPNGIRYVNLTEIEII